MAGGIQTNFWDFHVSANCPATIYHGMSTTSLSYKDSSGLYIENPANATFGFDSNTSGDVLTIGSNDGREFIGWFAQPEDSTGQSTWPNVSDYTELVSSSTTIRTTIKNERIWYYDSRTNTHYGNLYAKFSVPTYTVTYSPGSNGTGTQKTVTKQDGEDIYLDGALFTRTGYVQVGWATSDGGGLAFDLYGTYSGNANITLYPVWGRNGFSVVYAYSPGSLQRIEDTKTKGSPLALRGESFTHSGYTQTAWTTNQMGGGKTYGLGAIYYDDADITLYPVWTPKKFTVTFDANGGEGGTSALMDFGSKITPPTVTREGHTFQVWLPKVLDRVPAYDVTYAAQWIANRYRVTFDANGGEGGISYTADFGNAISPPSVYLEGHTFDGWEPSVPPTVPAYDSRYVAKWKGAQYTVSFKLHEEDEQPYATKTVTFGEPIGELPVPNADYGYYFSVWLYQEGVVIGPDYVVDFTEDVTLVAEFSPKQITFTLDATCGGRYSPGTAGSTTATYIYDATEPSITCPTMTDFTFLGYFDVEGNKYFDENGELSESIDWDKITGESETIKLSAKWVKELHTLTFNSDGGTPVDQITQSYDDFVNVPEPPTKAGYTFAGWNPRIPRWMPKSDGTYTATWTGNQYKVQYALVGGTFGQATAPTDATFGTVLSVPAPTRTGCTFAGWKVSDGLDATTAKWGTSAQGANTSITSSATVCFNSALGAVYFLSLTSERKGRVTLTATWNDTYTVTYKEGSESETEYADTKFKGASLELRGETFSLDDDGITEQVGWTSDESDGGGKTEDGAEIEYPVKGEYLNDANITLYPVFAKKVKGPDTIKVLFTAGQGVSGTDAIYFTSRKFENGFRVDRGYSYSHFCKNGTVIDDGVEKSVHYEQIGWEYSDGTNTVTDYFTGHGESASISPSNSATQITVRPVFGSDTIQGASSNRSAYATGVFDNDYPDPSNEYENKYGSNKYTIDASFEGTITLWSGGFRRPGYIQIGWTTAAGGTIVEEGHEFGPGEYALGGSYTGSPVTFYPIWESAENYVIEYAENYLFKDGALPPISASWDEIVTVPVPVKSGFRFKGWLVCGTDRSYLGRYGFGLDSSEQKVVDNIVDGGLCIPVGDTEQLTPPDPNVTPTNFKNLADCTGITQGGWGSVQKTVTLQATWEKIDEYGVRYHRNEDDFDETTFLDNDFAVGVPKNLKSIGTEQGELDWERAGYIFGGWEDNGDGDSIIYPEGALAVDLNGTEAVTEGYEKDLYAVWIPVTGIVQLRIDDYETEAIESDADVVEDAIAIVPAPKTTGKSGGVVSCTFENAQTETFTPAKTIGEDSSAKRFALVTDYITQRTVIERDLDSWTERIEDDASYLVSYGAPIPASAGYTRDCDRTMGAVTVDGKFGDPATVDALYGDYVLFEAKAYGGFVFAGWYSGVNATRQNLYSIDGAITVQVHEPIMLYAKFEPDPNGIYEWEGSTTNKLMEWRSKTYVASKPFNPSAIRIDSTAYPPVELTVDLFSSPDTAATDTATLVNMDSQDARRLPRMRDERYMQIAVKHDAEVDAIFVGTSMGGLAV